MRYRKHDCQLHAAVTGMLAILLAFGSAVNSFGAANATAGKPTTEATSDASTKEGSDGADSVAQARQQVLRGDIEKAKEALRAVRAKNPDASELKQVEALCEAVSEAYAKFEKGMKDRDWDACGEALQMLKEKGVSNQWRTSLNEKVQIMRQAEAVLAQVKRAIQDKKHEDALALGKALENSPLAAEWTPLRRECAQEVLHKAQSLVKESKGREAWALLARTSLEGPEVQALLGQISAELGPKCREQGLLSLREGKLADAAKDLALARQMLGDKADVAEALAKCTQGLAAEYRKKVTALLAEKKPGEALVYAVAAAAMEGQSPSGTPDLAKCLDAVRQRIQIEVGLAVPVNSSLDPALGARFFDGVFRELWNRKVRGISVFDEKRWAQRQVREVAADSNAMRLTIELTSYPMTAYTRECVRTELRKYQAGTVKTRNPEYDGLAGRKEVLEARELQLKNEERGYKDAAGQAGLSGLFGAAGNLVQGGPGLAIVSGIGGLASMVQHQQIQGEVRSDLSTVSSELGTVTRQMKQLDAFEDEPIYKEFTDNREYFYKTALGRCGIKLIDVSGKEDAVISAREVVEQVTSSDRYVVGNPLAGVKADPKDLPPDGEMLEEVLNKTVKAAADDVEYSLGQIFLGYCARAAAADARKDAAKADEDASNFIASNAVHTHPEYALRVAAYLNARIADLIPGADPAKCTWAQEVFGVEAPKLAEKPAAGKPPAVAGLHGIMIVFEDTGPDSGSGTVADAIASLLREKQRSVVVKSLERMGNAEDFRKSRAENLVAFGRKEGRRIAMSVTAETSVTGEPKLYNMKFCDVQAQVEIIAVDAASGETLFERSTRDTSRHMDKTIATKAALQKAMEKAKEDLVNAVQGAASQESP